MNHRSQLSEQEINSCFTSDPVVVCAAARLKKQTVSIGKQRIVRFIVPSNDKTVE